MQKDVNVNGGTKLLTASVVMTLGVGGALLFRQDAPATPRPESASGELLVRRSGAAPTAADYTPNYAAPYDRSPQPLSTGAQLTGSIDPFQNPGTIAGTERRLTADYGRPNPTQPPAAPTDAASQFPFGAPPYGASPGSGPLPPHRYFVDPTSEAERTPMNNVTAPNAAANPQLPAEYPSAEANATASTSPANSALGPMTPLGDRNRSAFVNAGIGPVANASVAAPNVNSPSTIGRTVMPTLRADSGATAPTTPPQYASSQFSSSTSAAPADEPARPKSTKPARRHRVRDGDTLASLAQRYYNDPERYSAIYDANRGVLSNPDLLPIGVELMIPPADQAAAAAATSAVSTPPPAARLLPRVQIRPLGE